MHTYFKRAAASVLIATLLTTPAWATTPSNGAASYHGVDIYRGDSSNNQIDWDKLAQTQNFAYIKASEGVSYVDPMWTDNRAQAAAHDMAWGPYHFLRLYSVASAKQQADNYWARIRGTGYSLIPAVDVESHDGQQDAAAMRTIIRAFVDEFKTVSRITPVLYTYTSYANDILRGQFTDCKLWLADYRGYAGTVAGWGSWDAWQYSDKGQISAISNDEVDLDYAVAAIWLTSPSKTPSATPVTHPGVYKVAKLPQSPNSVAGADLAVLDSNGEVVSGRSISKGDLLIIASVDYDKQLTEVYYPVPSASAKGGYWMHAYIHNTENLLHNTGYRAWHNGSTSEPTYTENGTRIGTIYSYECATVLGYTSDGRVHVLYNTTKGPETKDGYVWYPGN